MTITASRLSPDVEGVVAWENDAIVARYARTYATTHDESAACFTAWKQFMAVMITRGPENTNVPSDRIDDMWHTALMFTGVYREFCADHMGGFIDHNPQDHTNPSGYIATRDTALELFGDLDERFWTDQGACCGT